MKSRFKKHALIAASVVLTLTATACGSDDDAADTTQAAVQTTSAPAAETTVATEATTVATEATSDGELTAPEGMMLTGLTTHFVSPCFRRP